MKTLDVLIDNLKSCLYLGLEKNLSYDLPKEKKPEVGKMLENRFRTTALAQTKTSLDTLDLRKQVEKREKMSIEERANLSNSELLNFDQEERLEFVTDPIVDYTDVVS